MASALGIQDVLIFRRIASGQYAHLGGLGRGESWAGIVEIEAGDNQAFGRAIQDDVIVRTEGLLPRRIAGPYYARTAAIVPLNADTVVVLGSAEQSSTLNGADDLEVTRVARSSADGVGGVSPAKRLADELEILHAVKSLTSHLNKGPIEAGQAVASVAATALDCDLAALLLPSGRLAMSSTECWSTADQDAVALVLSGLSARTTGTVCVQDAAAAPLPAPLSPQDGVLSYLFVSMTEGGGGLLLAHLERRARGFTQLCVRLGEQIAEAGSVLIQASSLRAHLQQQLAERESASRRDPLTGVANRLAWTEAMGVAQEEVDAGEVFTVVSIDLDRLKDVNDLAGHSAGDRLLVTVADRLSSALRDCDRVFRVGGDEFVVLLPVAGRDSVQTVLDRLRHTLSSGVSPDGYAVAGSLGTAVCRPGQRMAQTFHDADMAMYATKRSRRRSASAVR